MGVNHVVLDAGCEHVEYRLANVKGLEHVGYRCYYRLHEVVEPEPRGHVFLELEEDGIFEKLVFKLVVRQEVDAVIKREVHFALKGEAEL